MGKIKVSRRSYENRKGMAQVIVTVTFNSEKVRIPTGLKASASCWDEKKQCFRGRTQDAADKNLIIEQLRSRVNNVLVKARLRDEKLTKESFMRYFSNPNDFDTFHDFMTYYYNKVYRLKEENTLKTYRTIMKKIQSFEPGLSFGEINYDFGMRLAAHLRKSGAKESTVWKNMKTFKVFVEAAKREGYIERTTFDQIKIRKVKSEVVYLDENEFRRLISLYHDNVLSEARQNVLRFFLFMASTSPHVGDAKDLRIEQFRMGELHYQRRKTRKDVTVPLTPLAVQIFEFYRQGRQRGKLFMSMLPSEQKINKHLKEIAKEANIDKKISCKTARHTFATIFYRHSKDIYALKEILGHSDLKDTMVYAHLLDDAKLEGMKAFDAFT
ncbi:MAG: site-specific integrase [Bacteroidales bacterium]|nr:site-specific integrase [Bacteroidales bacterium]MBR4238288.1 site-specific integrase [Prevotella sp.]